ncbi:MAG: hypothetical protein ACRCW7_00970, partial [Cetobacterium sp.]
FLLVASWGESLCSSLGRRGLGHSAVSTAILSSYESHIISLSAKSYGGNLFIFPPFAISAIKKRELPLS